MCSAPEPLPDHGEPALAETRREALRQLALSAMARAAPAMRRLGGGRNSQVFAVHGPDAVEVVLKCYHRAPDDPRDRLRTEFEALSFLWREGERAIPEPLAAFPELGCAVLGLVAGQAVPPGQATDQDLSQLAAFWERLDELAGQGKGGSLPAASEAGFSDQELVQILAGRRARLDGLSGPLAREAADFLEGPFDLLLNEVLPPLLQGPAFERILEAGERTLSPSDFGFHNTIRRPDGRLAFLDFEYFGWDDPVKLASDVVLHPGMGLSEEAGMRFLCAVARRAPRPGVFAARLARLLPLHALKWTLILLNEFTRSDALRRAFAGGPEDHAALRAQQLDKAAGMLQRARALFLNPILLKEHP